MAELSTIARPYAEAAFEIAREKNALANWSGMLSLVSSVASDARMRAALASPTLGDAEKESLCTAVAELAVAGASKILKREVDPKAHAELLREIQGQL